MGFCLFLSSARALALVDLLKNASEDLKLFGARISKLKLRGTDGYLSRDDFMLAIEGTDVTTRPQSATVLSAKLTKDANSGVTTAASVGVGVDIGTYTDPATGQRVHVRA